MFFLNLSAAELLALLGATSALVVTLYLLNRARRRQTVATLRFWVHAVRPESSQQRRRIQQPFSLLLQLISLALLMFAVAQPRIGSSDSGARDHVLVLDTSSWMAAGTGGRTLMDEAKRSAVAYVDRIPGADRLMLVRADGLSVPATSMTDDREAVRQAIQDSRPAASALDLEQALTFAAQTRRMNARSPGEVVFIGAGRTREAIPLPNVSGLRFIPVRAEYENSGLRRIGLRRSAAEAGAWDVFVSVRNYGRRPATLPVIVQYGGAQFGGQRVNLAPGAERELSFRLRTDAAGWVEARLLTRDALPDDDRAVVEIPPKRPVKVAVYTKDPAALRPLLLANPYVQASFHSPGAPAITEADIAVLDGFEPPVASKVPTLWLQPPDGSAVRIRTRGDALRIVRWRSDHELCAGLNAGEVELESASIFAPREGDLAIAEVEAGPVILARTRPQRTILVGYHPAHSDARFDVMTPLLFANMLRWLKPEAFQSWEVQAQHVGLVTAALDREEAAGGGLRVTDESGRLLPHDLRGRTLRFFSGQPGVVRVSGERGERVYSLTLPEVGEAEWKPVNAATGLPPRWSRPLAHDIWHWLAILGLAGFAAEWMLYGRSRRVAATSIEAPQRAFAKKAS